MNSGNRYPELPGSKAGTGPSQEAADALALKVKLLRDLVLDTVPLAPDAMTADEIAEVTKLSPFTVRPSVAELKRLGLITATSTRRRNASGASATAWQRKFGECK